MKHATTTLIRPPLCAGDADIRIRDALCALLDEAQDHLVAGNTMEALRVLNQPLTTLWKEACHEACAERVSLQARTHSLRALLHHDPYTKYAWTKPRGYAGDAVLMDYIYRNQLPPGTDTIGRAIFTVITRAFTSMSVRFRRQLLRSLVDDTVAMVPRARILSVAAGHARELEGSLVTSRLFDGEFVALDQDPLACAEVACAYAGLRVRPLTLGVIDLVRRRNPELGCFDLIYSAGLFDYLPDHLARRLVKQLLKLLRPQGRLVLANFVPETRDRGYMELFMDWHLVYRSEETLRTLASDAGGAVLRSFPDPHGNVVYVEVAREM